jgi:hypothetical protein
VTRLRKASQPKTSARRPGTRTTNRRLRNRLSEKAHIHGQSSAPTTEKICSAVASLTSASVGGIGLSARLARITASVRAVISHMPIM